MLKLWMFNDDFSANLLLKLTAKKFWKFWKSFRICQSYGEIIVASLWLLMVNGTVFPSVCRRKCFGKIPRGCGPKYIFRIWTTTISEFQKNSPKAFWEILLREKVTDKAKERADWWRQIHTRGRSDTDGNCDVMSLLYNTIQYNIKTCNAPYVTTMLIVGAGMTRD